MSAPEQEDTKMVALPEVKVKVTMSNVLVSQHSTPNGGRVYVINMKYPSNMLLIICAFTIFYHNILILKVKATRSKVFITRFST